MLSKTIEEFDYEWVIWDYERSKVKNISSNPVLADNTKIEIQMKKQTTKVKPKPKTKVLNKANVSIRLIDKVTTTNLDIALRMVGYQLDKTLIDRIIDLVELIEDKGDDASIKDICKLQVEWTNGY